MVRRRSARAAQNEQKLEAAVAGVSTGKFKTASRAAKVLGLSKSTVYRQKSGGLTRAQAWEAQHILSRPEEKALIVWLTMMAATGNPLNHSFVREMAEEIRQKWLVGINDEYATLVTYPSVNPGWLAFYNAIHL